MDNEMQTEVFEKYKMGTGFIIANTARQLGKSYVAKKIAREEIKAKRKIFFVAHCEMAKRQFMAQFIERERMSFVEKIQQADTIIFDDALFNKKVFILGTGMYRPFVKQYPAKKLLKEERNILTKKEFMSEYRAEWSMDKNGQ